MKLRNTLSAAIACMMSVTTLANAAHAATARQCLSPSERNTVGRLASIMAFRVALQRCGQCLGSTRYTQAWKSYDDAELDADFWKAKEKFPSTDAKFAYVNMLVRDSARDIAADMSADCSACEKMAETLKGLSSASARGDFYQRETAALADTKESGTCP